MKTLMMAGMAAVALGSGPPEPQPDGYEAREAVKPLLIAQGRTPDTSTPGSTAPGNLQRHRQAYVPRQERIYAAELRKCETLGNAEERLACKNSARDRYGEM